MEYSQTPPPSPPRETTVQELHALLKDALTHNDFIPPLIAALRTRNDVLRASNLNGMRLQWSQLKGCDMHSASMQNADLRGANLRGADLRHALLQGAILSSPAQVITTFDGQGRYVIV